MKADASKTHIRKIVVVCIAVSLFAFAFLGGLSRPGKAEAAGLVAAYGFDEGSGALALDSSGNANSGTISNADWSANGRFGGALSFNGTNSWVSINDAPLFDLTVGMTLEAWVYPTTLSGWRTVMLKQSPSGIAYSLYAHDNAPRPAVYVNTGGGDTSSTGANGLPTGTWTHLAATYDGTVLRIFVDGVEVGSRPVSGSIVVSNDPVYIGGNALWGEYFEGLIDEVRVYDRALSSAEILADMDTPVGPPPVDTTSPTVTGVSPQDGAANVSSDAVVTATFSEPMDAGTINTATFELRDASNAVVPAAVTYSPATRTATLAPAVSLAAPATFTAAVSGGPGGAADLAGNALAQSVTWTFTTSSSGACIDAPNPIVCENAKPGMPSSEWDISGAGDPSIQGFADDASVNRGETIGFKINTDAADYRLDIYRMGYYGGQGARKVAVVLPSASLPQSQPACLTDSSTGLTDCGNWGVSASWNVPNDAVSGIYFAKLVRTDTGGASHIVFVVRDDAGNADILFQTSDTTWQAYNNWGGKSLYDYQSTNGQRAFKVSYNRPYNTRENSPTDWVFDAEYPMVRWLEANGYNVSYFTGVDSERLGSQILAHKVFFSVGHDEYWSGQQRSNVEAARNAGVHLAFFSGNEIFWKTRWENSIAPANTPYRTLVSYKETSANAVIDPADPPVWTGTWRDPRFSPPADGGRPENELSGTISTVNGDRDDAIAVPYAEGRMRFWRNTAIAQLAPGETAVLPVGTLGYEWDEDLDNGFRPPGLIRLSSTTLDVSGFYLLDYGNVYGAGVATHSLTLYRHPSGALVFGAGTVQWSWGLDSNHDRGSLAADPRMQQATVNLLADMSVQPGSLQAGLVPASASADATAPSSGISSPANGSTLQSGTPVTITGTAGDTGGVVGGVEVSVDGGTTWHPALGRESWTYSWTPLEGGSVTILSRAVDDSGNLQSPAASITVTVDGASGSTGSSIWSGTTIPTIVSENDPNAIELGVKFQSDVDGFITGLRFYKGPTNTGTHTGSLWTSGGTLLASVTFVNETATGWQEMLFPSPVAITANTTYVASYHTTAGNYSVDTGYFAGSGVANPPLRALADGADGGNGVYLYGAGGFPTQTFNASNYWVDVVFTTGINPDTTPPTVTSTIPPGGAVGVDTGTVIAATFSEAMDTATIDAARFELRDAANAPVAASVTYDSATQTATLTPSAPLAVSTTYTAIVRGGSGGVTDVAGNPLATDFVWSFTTSVQSGDITPPTVTSVSPPAGAVGVSDLTVVTAVFSEAMDAGTLNTNTFELRDPSNTVVPGTVSYDSATNSVSLVPNLPLAVSTTYTATVLGGPAGARDLAGNSLAADFSWTFTISDQSSGAIPPPVSLVLPANGVTGVSTATRGRVIFSEAMNAATINTATIGLFDAANAPVTASITYDSTTNTAFLTPAASLATSATYTAVVKGGVGGVRTLTGNIVASDFAWSFTTAASSASGNDPGGPVLVITSAANPFSRYYTEILRAEGLNIYSTLDISSVSAATLAGFDVVILGEVPLTSTQVDMFTAWVNAGGNLIAMRPDKKLAGLLGLVDLSSTLAEGYILVDSASGPGVGIVNQTIQFHGTADRYDINGADSVATLYLDAATASTSPAVTLRNVGTNGGKAAAFTFDLARSIVLTRQGNPDWADQDRDGVPPIRADDLFFGSAVGDPQPDWVDLDKVAIPQADEQQRLLANLVIQMNFAKKPLPRFWYFPRGFEAVVIMTGDNHGFPGIAERFDSFAAQSPAGCSVEDWECVRGTSYSYSSSSPLSETEALGYNDAGFEVAMHLYTNCDTYTPGELDSFFSSQFEEWRNRYPNLPPFATDRNHCIAWGGYTTLPEVGLDYGIRFETSYYYYPGSWVLDRPGFFTGSGMPMRFAKADGSLIDVYQAVTQMTDESGQSYPFTINALLDKAIGPEKYYGAFTVNMHTDGGSSVESNEIVQSALVRGVPVITSRQMMDWLDGRNGSSFGSFSWNGNTLGFTVSTVQGARGLQAMVPIIPGLSADSVLYNGSPIGFTVFTIKGINYAVFPALDGSYEVAFAADQTLPKVVSSFPVDGATDVSAGESVQATFSEAMDAATINTTTFELRDSANVKVAATVAYNSSTKTATLTADTNLKISETYTATILSGSGGVADMAGNSLAADFSWSFTITDKATIWNNSEVPMVTSVNDPNAIELGVKFQSDVDGFITGLRFYKGPTNTGTHTGSLWTSGGTLLASVTFVNETATGWQEMLFPSPVAITANTTYVASYHTTAGNYSADEGYFANSGVARYPLRALADGEDGPNGLFKYGAGGFPDQSFGSTNYWVDVVFKTDVGPDTTAPTVSSTVPADGAVDVSPQTAVSVTFSEPMDAATIGTTTFELLDAANAPVTATVAYDSGTNTATLVPDASLAVSATYTAVVRGGSGGVADVAGNPLAADFSWSFTTAAADTTPPTVINNLPAQDSVVDVNTSLSVTFSEAMDTGTIDATTFTLLDGANVSVPATVSYNSGTNTATLVPDLLLAPSTTYTAIVSGGPSGVSDIAGNPMATDFTWSFSTSSGSASSSIWSDAAVPTVLSADDPSAVELGVKFQSDVDGFITGLRFYKGPTNTGTHTGSLWTSGGTLLASVTFVNETATGWQEMLFPSPVAITANTTYVASYHTTAGNYSVDTGYFAGSGVANPPLRALADGADGGNGVYLYGAGGFPTQTFNASNYWVDVVFKTDVGPDTTAPTVSSTVPADGAVDVSPQTAVSVTFSEPMDAATIGTTTFELLDAANAPVTATVAYDSGTNTATLVPDASLAVSATYTAVVRGGSGGVADVAGNPLAADFSWSFTTAAAGTPVTYRIWDAAVVPAIESDSDTGAVELGMKFQSTQDGFITGLYFYKGAANTGVHVGSLWTAAGTLLASVTYTNETASGWQFQALPTPVPIAANTTYVVSYHAPAGRYAVDSGYFAGAGAANGPLRALADGESGGNGVYLYGAGGFPNQSWNASNYWVDVEFQQ